MTISVTELMPEDLEHILTHTETIWDDIRGKKIFMTGGTGFFGKWFLESFIYANKALNLNASLTCLTRDSKQFLKKHPFFEQQQDLHFWDGDIRDFDFKHDVFDILIHAATEASVHLNQEQPLLMWDTIVLGSKRVLDFVVHAKIKQCLILSSGAVYGPAFEGEMLAETYANYPLSEKTASAYAYGKRSAEQLAMLYRKTYGLDLKIARCFAFVGPYLPLDTHFAMGNFISNVLHDLPIVIKGDGSTIRSYLYTADLMIWLWTILIKGKAGEVYNVGSNDEISLFNLAHMLKLSRQSRMEIICHQSQKTHQPIESYTPNIEKATKELNLKVLIDLKTAIAKTLKWHSLAINGDGK